jgi:hypothetical protein
MTIDYPADKTFELHVKDTGTLDQFDVFVNDTLRSHVANGELNTYEIEHPATTIAIVVQFEGVDGGRSAIVDVTDTANPKVVTSQSGLNHSYLLEATP